MLERLLLMHTGIGRFWLQYYDGNWINVNKIEEAYSHLDKITNETGYQCFFSDYDNNGNPDDAYTLSVNI